MENHTMTAFNDKPILENLKAKSLDLNTMRDELNIVLASAKHDLQASFTTSKLDTDKLSATVSSLEAKQSGLENGLGIVADEIAQEEKRLIDEEYSKQREIQCGHVVEALKAVDRSVVLADKLNAELEKVAEHNRLAVLGGKSDAVHNSIRGIVGRLAFNHTLQGPLMMANTIPLATIDDASNICSHIH